jgi:hypothetical protein
MDTFKAPNRVWLYLATKFYKLILLPLIFLNFSTYLLGWLVAHSDDFFNLLTPELNPSAQRCLTRLFTGYFASWTVHFINICVKNQQIQQLFIQFINYVW